MIVIQGLSPLPSNFEFHPVGLWPDADGFADVGGDFRSSTTALSNENRFILQQTSTSRLYFTPGIGTASPFSWGAGINWTALSHAVVSDQQLIRLVTHDTSRFNALFYSFQEAPSTISQTEVITFLKQVVSSVANGLAHEGMSSAYSWLAQLPRSTVLSVFQSFPNEIMNVLRQRVLAQAVSGDDPVFVQAMLELGYYIRADFPFPDSDVSSVLQGLLTPDCGLEKAQSLEICMPHELLS